MKDKLIKFWKKLKCWVAGPYAVFEAVRDSHPNPKRLANLLQDGLKPNVYDELGYTPLQLSLLYDQYECILILLEQGADPNLRCLGREDSPLDRGQTLQPYLYLPPRFFPPGVDSSFKYQSAKQHNTSIIKLLVLYGATEEGLRFYSRALREELYKARELYLKKQAWEAYATKCRDPLLILSVHQDLHEIWQQLSDEEVGNEPLQKILRAHYQKKALFYAEKVRQLASVSPPSPTPAIKNPDPKEEVVCFSHPAKAYDSPASLRKRHTVERELVYEEKVPLLKEHSQQLQR